MDDHFWNEEEKIKRKSMVCSQARMCLSRMLHVTTEMLRNVDPRVKSHAGQLGMRKSKSKPAYGIEMMMMQR